MSAEAELTAWPSSAFVALPIATTAETENVLVRLRSLEPHNLAWGGYLAGTLGIREAGSALLAALGSTRDAAVIKSLLDGLVRTGTHVPAGLLREVSQRRGLISEDVLVVALADPRAHADMLRDHWSSKAGTVETHAAANALTMLRDKPFVAELLARLDAKVTINVRGSHDPLLGWGGGCMTSFTCSCGGLMLDSTMPPTPIWHISGLGHGAFDAVDEALIIELPGPRGAWLTRTERSARRFEIQQELDARFEEELADAGEEAEDDRDETLDDTAEDDLEDIAAATDDDASRAIDDLPHCTDEAAVADTYRRTTTPVIAEHTAYLAALLARDPETLFEDTETIEHVWRGPEAYDALVRDVRGRLEGRYQELGDALAAADLLPENIMRTPLPVSIERFDRRSCDRAEPL